MPSALFVHNGSSGRFAPVATALMARGWDCALLNPPVGTEIKGARHFRWRLAPDPRFGQIPLTLRPESDVMHGVSAATTVAEMVAGGFRPDVIIGHPGWGEMLFLKEVLPDTPQIQVGEFYYRTRGADTDFDAEFTTNASLNSRARVHAKNMGLSLSYTDAARIVCPTPFQASLLPAHLQDRVAIIHEGIDVERARRVEAAQFTLSNGAVLSKATPTITFINRVFEPLRGFHVFMRTLPDFLARMPEAQVLIIGSESSQCYGPAPPAGMSWKQVMLQELQGKLDLDRVHFAGRLTYEQLTQALSISAAHVYLTYPFVLSWSLLDAMACECLVIGSNTAPVRDVVTDGVNGLLVDFFDRAGLCERMAQACSDPSSYANIRSAARDTVVQHFDQNVETAKWMALIDDTITRAAA